MILFAAGDVGGARALLPIAAECERHGLPFAVLHHGHIAQEAPDRWPLVSLPSVTSGANIAAWLSGLNVSALIFGSSVHDLLPLTLAGKAHEIGIFVVHVLDNWSNYRRRLGNDDLPILVPDIYTVMDDLAREAAIADGVLAEIIRVTGQPALASLVDDYAGVSGRSRGQGPVRLLFVSEPVEADQGSSPESPRFRGYTEKNVLRLLCRVLQPYADQVTLDILPHPREERRLLVALWKENRLALNGMVLANKESGRQQLLAADGVIGMASILLYEAWLVGKPVLSLQPGLADRSLRMLAKRAGVCFIDAEEQIVDAFASWLAMLRRGGSPVPQPDLLRHQEAAGQILALLAESGVDSMRKHG